MIERVPLKERAMIPVFQSNNPDYEAIREANKIKDEPSERQNLMASVINSIPQNEKKEDLGIWEAMRTTNNFNVRAQQALQPFTQLKKNDHVTFFDIEALGTPEHLRDKDSEKLFAITELSFRGTQFTGEDFAKNQGGVVSMAIAPGKIEYEKMRDTIQELKKNPLMGISKDMHRSLLDLVKYSDVNNFSTGSMYGTSFAVLEKHKRVPTALTALTGNTLKEIEMGLENLYTKGTKLEDAFAVFQSSVTANKSKVAGYNVHHYDLPAMMGAATNKSTKAFLESISKSSLDFYHGYSAVAEDPFRLTGASTRQEHIHQYLIEKGKVKAEKTKYQYHLAADDILANIEIGGFTTNEILGFINGTKNKSTSFPLSPRQMKTDILKKGTEVFSYQSGYFDQKKHKYNLVATEKEGKVTPRWANLDTSLPSSERFVVGNFFENVKHPDSDKPLFGVELLSNDIYRKDKDGNIVERKKVMLFSETLEELAQQIHGSFLPMNEENSQAFRNLKAQVDQPYQEYRKMFGDQGWYHMNKLYKYLDGEDAPVNGSASDWTEYVLSKGGSDELALKFPHLKERLEKEKEVWSPVMQQLEKANMTDEQRSMVLRHVKNELDVLGENKDKVTVDGGRFFSFTFDENNQRVFDAKNPSSIKSSMRSYINEVNGESYRVSRIRELNDLIINQFGFHKESAESAKVLAITEGMVREVQSGGKIETALTSLSNMVQTQIESRGTNSFEREVTNKVTTERVQAISKLKENLPQVIDDSIEYAKSIRSGKDALIKNSPLDLYARGQDEKIMKLYARNFRLNNDANVVKEAGKAAAKYRELLGSILEQYSRHLDTQVFMRDDGTAYLVLGDKGKGVSSREIKTYEELIQRKRTAVVELPGLDDDLMTRIGNERKVSVMKSGRRKGKQYHSVSATDALQSILNQSGDRLDKILLREKAGVIKDPFLEIQQGLKFAVSKSVNPVAGESSTKLSYDDQRFYDAQSKIATSARGGYWDISGYAEDWYRDNAARLGLAQNSIEASRKANEILERAEANNTSFADEMEKKAREFAIAGELQTYVENQTHLRGSMHGINVRGAGKLYVGTTVTDSRIYTALGSLMGDSGENPLKTINYRKLDKDRALATLDKSGRSQDYRLNHSFITDEAHALIGDGSENRGIAMRTGYMSDEELAFKLKDSNRIAKYKQMIEEAKKDNRITDKQARQMIGALESGMLSTSEGLSVIDAELMSAYDGWDDVRVKINSKDPNFHPTIEQAIREQAAKQGIEGDAWKKQNITFDKPLEIDVSDLFDKDGKITLGKYMINGMELPIEEQRRLRRDKKISIMGYDGTQDTFSSTLVLGRERLSGQGTKIVTENGFRATTIPMLREVMSDLYGADNIEFLRSYLEGEKKSANSAGDFIRGIDMDIRDQFSGVVSKKIKGYRTQEEALNAFYSGLEKELGISTTVQSNGVRTISGTFGANAEEVLNKKDFDSFIKEWNTKLGNEREVAASINMAHNVYTNFGTEGAAKVTTKEINMIDKAFQQMKITEHGKQSNLGSWLVDQVYGSNASKEVQVKKKVYGETLSAVGNYNANDGWQPKVGDAVIDFTAEGNDIEGGINGKVENGILKVSKNTYQQVETKMIDGQVFTVGSYNKSVINAGAATIFTEGADGKTVEKTLQARMMESKGTIYMKMPEEMKHQYIPIIDAASMQMPGENFKDEQKYLSSIQGKYASISRRLEEYNNLHVNSQVSGKDIEFLKADVIEKLNKDTGDLLELFRSTATSKDGVADVLTARLDNSTRLQSTGHNPLLAYKRDGEGKWSVHGNIQESHVYMNADDVRTQIKGIEKNIAQSWRIDMSDVKGDLADYLIQNWNNYDTYVITNRNPSIDTATIQTAKVKIHDGVGQGQMLGMRGMGERISEDYDGDQKGVFFSHYGEKNEGRRNAILSDMKRAFKIEQKRNTTTASIIMNGIEKDFRNNLLSGVEGATVKQVDAIVDQFFSPDGLHNPDKLTLGGLHGQEVVSKVESILQKTHNEEYKHWGFSKMGDGSIGTIEHTKTILARATGQTIGSADVIRMKMGSAFDALADAKYKYFKDAEGSLRYTQADATREKAMVDEFLREFSQKSISSKHAEGGKVTDEIAAVHDLMDRVRNVRNDRNLRNLAQDIVDRGMFKKDILLEIGDGQVYRGSGVDFVEQTLGFLKEAEMTYQDMGMQGSYDTSLLNANSKGIGLSRFSEMLQKGEYTPTLANKFMAEMAQEHGHEKMAMFQQRFEEGVIRSHTKRHQNIQDRLSDGFDGSEIMNNRTVPNPEVISNKAVPIQRTIRDGMDSTFMDIAAAGKHKFSAPAASMLATGAIGFAGLWATNALMKAAPTPEGLQEMAPVDPSIMASTAAPTARVTPNDGGEYINISVSAKAAQRMNTQDLAAMLNSEVLAMSNVKMKTHVNVNDDSTTVDSKFVEGAVANAMNKGYAY